MTLSTAVLLASVLARPTGFTSGYEPFPDALQVPQVACSELEWTELHVAESTCGAPSSPLPIRVRYTPEGACLAVGPSSAWIGTATTLGGLDIYSARLNSDSTPDAVAVFWGSGCGLASLHCSVVVALSDGESFVFWQLEAMGFGPSALLRLPDRPGTTLVHTLVREALGRDGRHHSFWIHSLFGIDGNTLAPTADEPIWILYAFTDNHTPTRQLSMDQKRSIRREKAMPQYARLGSGCTG